MYNMGMKKWIITIDEGTTMMDQPSDLDMVIEYIKKNTKCKIYDIRGTD